VSFINPHLDLSHIVISGHCRVPKKALENFATIEDVTSLHQTYDEYFDGGLDDEVEAPIPEVVDFGSTMKAIDCDFGMEMEASMSWEMLDQRLGLRKGVFPSFNSHRHRSGISPWDDEKPFMLSADDSIPSHLSILKLHWHQVAGIHSILRSIFSTDQSHPQVSSILVGDEVGLGKTAQTIGLIAYLNYVIYLQEHKKPLPPIISMSLSCDY